MAGKALALLLKRQNNRLLNRIVLGTGQQIRMKYQRAEAARAFLQDMGGMNIPDSMNTASLARSGE